jgi:hypothetical protein
VLIKKIQKSLNLQRLKRLKMGFNCTKFSLNDNRTMKYWSGVKTKKTKVVELGLRFSKLYGTLKSDQK